MRWRFEAGFKVKKARNTRKKITITAVVASEKSLSLEMVTPKVPLHLHLQL